MKVLYARSYIERELYVVEKDGKYLQVYASSGLNPGRKGRILPFAGLADPERATISSEFPGYIYKEIFIDGRWLNHRKEPQRMSPAIGPFLLELEEFLKPNKPEYEAYENIKMYEDIRPVVREINAEMSVFTDSMDPYDWREL